MDDSHSWQLHRWVPRFPQNGEIPAGQEGDDASLQASFEHQLYQLQSGSREDGGGQIQRSELGPSLAIPVWPNARDDLFSDGRYTSNAAAHEPAASPQNGSQQPELVNTEIREGRAKRDRSEPFAEDVTLVSAFKKAARAAGMPEPSVKTAGANLTGLSSWLRQNFRAPIANRFGRDSPGHDSFVSDVGAYLKDGGRSAVVGLLNKIAPGSLPSADELIGELPAEDANLLARLRADGARRKIPKTTIDKSFYGLRAFMRWLQANKKDPIATRLQGDSLSKDLSTYRSQGGDPQYRLKSALEDLPRLASGGENAEARGPGTRAMGRRRGTLAPHPEDDSLIQSALNQALHDLRSSTPTQRQSAQKRASRLRGFSAWLKDKGGESVIARLNGPEQQQGTLQKDVTTFRQARGRVADADLSHLRSYLKLIEANRALGMQAREQLTSPAVPDARRPKLLQVLPAPSPSGDGAAFLSEAVQEPASSSAAKARSDTYAGLESFVDLNPPTPFELRDDAHFAPLPARARSDTFAGLESFVDLNAQTPSELRDDAHFAPLPARARSDTFAGLESFVDLDAPTPSELDDDAHFAPAQPARARSDTFADLESLIDLNPPTPFELRDDAHFAPLPTRARSDTFAGLESFVDLNAPTPSELDDDAHIAPAEPARARSDTFADVESLIDLNAPTPSELRDDAHFAPAHSADTRSDSYGDLSIIDLNTPPPSELDEEVDSARAFPAPTSAAQIGGWDPTAPSRGPGLVLGDEQWLGDEHIQRDYELLEQWLQENHPDLAVRTQLVDPLVAHYQIRLAAVDGEARSRFQRLIDRNGDDTADFLFLPMNDADRPDQRGTHWSLLFVDRRDRQRPVAYHYDSIRGYNDGRAAELARRLGLSRRPAEMAQQQNSYDCGVFVLDGTRALVRGLAIGQPDLLNLKNLRVSRLALQNRLRS
ncbi:type III effector protein XopD [Bradyrhizobium sp. Rc2d]|uniref:Ulp1 family isopeptidase n=1 Tax=Bradyrhizobium sp. Rc2d TaxID=1855321 RepID=UPI00087ECCB3|nr:Ulp1 family isopeptidase [Bradyrhizobium sp. Rc2d]SDJ12506.1 type III effector protein XopD [Bradyrhizobium sp. Rc2d]